MLQENLIITCDEVLTMEARPSQQATEPPVMRMMLDDVYIDELMLQLVKKLDVADVLDYFTPAQIKEYLEKESG